MRVKKKKPPALPCLHLPLLSYPCGREIQYWDETERHRVNKRRGTANFPDFETSYRKKKIRETFQFKKERDEHRGEAR